MIAKSIIIGIDEAGRGSWAGPLAAAAVCVNDGLDKGNVADSKSISAKRRQECLRYVQSTALQIGIGWVAANRIDKIGIQAATTEAMLAALGQITGFAFADKIIVDGHINYIPGLDNATAVIRADETEPSVAAASIVAKCFRDRYMRAVAPRFEDYGFERHVGYGTAEHKAGLLRHGSCHLHRLSFTPVKLLTSK